MHAVVAIDTNTGDAIATAAVTSDGVGFYHIKDVIVLPDWQNQRVGTAVMLRLMRWIEQNSPDNATLGLFTGENLKHFYGRFGFSPAYGMIANIRKTPLESTPPED